MNAAAIAGRATWRDIPSMFMAVKGRAVSADRVTIIPHEGGGICVNHRRRNDKYKCNKIAESIRVIWHTLQAYPDR